MSNDPFAQLDPVELTGFARGRLEDRPVNQFITEQWFPNVEVDDLFWKLSQVASTQYTETASFRSFDTESDLAGNEGFTQMAGTLPPISRKSRVSEYTSIMRRNLPEEARTAVESDITKLVRMIRLRLELARMELVRTGKLVLNERGVQADIDFNRAAGHDVTPGTAWTDAANCDPFGDELGWVETYVDTNGYQPAWALMNTTTRALQLGAANVRSLAPKGLVAPSRLAPGALAEIRADEELPPVLLLDAKIAGNKVLADGEVVYMPPIAGDDGALGATVFGPTAEAATLALDASDAPGLAVTTWRDMDPIGQYTNVTGICLPITPNIDQTFRAVVN